MRLMVGHIECEHQEIVRTGKHPLGFTNPYLIEEEATVLQKYEVQIYNLHRHYPNSFRFLQ